MSDQKESCQVTRIVLQPGFGKFDLPPSGRPGILNIDGKEVDVRGKKGKITARKTADGITTISFDDE